MQDQVRKNTWSSRLYYPIKKQCSPSISKIKEDSEKFVTRHKLVSDEEGISRYMTYDIEKVASYAHPEASDDIIQIVADIATWMLFTDDCYDENKFGGDLLKLKTLLQPFYRVTESLELPKNAPSLISSLHDICQRSASLGDGFYEHFKKDMFAYWDACIDEAEYRSHYTSPKSASEYLELRSTSVGMYCLFDFIVPDRSLDPSITDDEHIKNIRKIASVIIACVNDLDSFYKEHEHDDPINLVSVYMKQFDISIEEARSLVIKKHNEEMNKFLNLISDPEIFYGERLEYALGLKSWVRAVYDWEKNCGRYNYVDNGDVLIQKHDLQRFWSDAIDS